MNDRDMTRDRFVASIADKVNPADIAEAHLFHPMKQGGMESGVAVVAVRQPTSTEDAVDAVPTGAEGAAEHVPDAQSASAENDPAVRTGAEGDAENDLARISVYTAKYRLTLKGPDRGKWAFDIHAEADAPLVAVDKVVLGVQRRSGDAELAEKLSGEEFRALLPSLPTRDPSV